MAQVETRDRHEDQLLTANIYEEVTHNKTTQNKTGKSKKVSKLLQPSQKDDNAARIIVKCGEKAVTLGAYLVIKSDNG